MKFTQQTQICNQGILMKKVSWIACNFNGRAQNVFSFCIKQSVTLEGVGCRIT